MKKGLFICLLWLIVSDYVRSQTYTWDMFVNTRLVLVQYGGYSDGKQLNTFFPTNRVEYIELTDNGVLRWIGSLDGDRYYTASINRDYLTLQTSNNFTSWLRIMGMVDNRLFTISREGTYRYFRIENKNSNTQLTSLPQSATNSSKEFCGGAVNDFIYLAEDNTYSPVTPMGKHFVDCPIATVEQRSWLEDARCEPDGVNEFNNWVSQTINLYPYNNPSPADVNQTQIGNCNTASILATMAYLYPEFIKSIIKAETSTSYAVSMFDPKGQRIIVRVSNKALCDNNGTVVQLTGKRRALTWSMILEKAIMKWLKVYKPNTGIWGFGAEHATPLFTGDGRSFSYSSGKLNTEQLRRMVITCLNNGLIVNGGFSQNGIKIDQHESVAMHGHSFMLPPTGDYLFCMRNPWGHGTDDHVMRIAKNAQYINTIDLRIISPGIAAKYFKAPLTPYYAPSW